MNVHTRSYPHTTTLAVPGHVRPPNTLHEHYVADPRGATSFKQYREDRIWELLQRFGYSFYEANGYPTGSRGGPLHELLAHAQHDARVGLRIRVQLGSTVIKEWAPVTS